MLYFLYRFSKRAAKQSCPFSVMLEHVKSITLCRFWTNAGKPA
jgi:hypothetical protein